MKDDLIVRLGGGNKKWCMVLRNYKGPVYVCDILLKAVAAQVQKYIREQGYCSTFVNEAYQSVEILGEDTYALAVEGGRNEP